VADAPTPVVFAIVTTRQEAVPNGGMAPVFLARDEQEQYEIAMWISRITNANVHDFHNGVMMLVVNAQSASSG
jgi:hypothetical protein